MLLTRLKSGHWGCNGTPAYQLVAKKRQDLKLSKGQFALRYGIDRASQYRFEAGKNKSLQLAILELEAVGYSVNIYVCR
jgi:hypothetical protein